VIDSAQKRRLESGERVVLLPGAPLRTTATVYTGATGRVVRVGLATDLMTGGESWMTVRFDVGGSLVQVPRRFVRHLDDL
jgi:hypothetical protein